MTTTPTLPESTTTPTAPRRRSRGKLVATGLVSAIAAAAIVGGVAFGFASHATTPAPTASSTWTVVVPDTAGTSGGSASNAGHHVTPPAKPSQAVETLQRELGQLNYYEGPVTGFMNQQTVQAITYLQRDAHLPQTGQLNAATQAALTAMLAHGNNVMGA